jgi:hypothetical protein
MSVGLKLGEIILDSHLVATLATPEPGEGRIGRETEEPGSKRRITAKCLGLLVDGQEDFLDHLFSFRGIS